MKIAIAILGSLVICAQGWAHHSFADYDRNEVRELEGELLQVRWRNPHVTFTVRVVEPNGEALDWVLETGAVYLVERAGLTEAMFPVNEDVRVAGWASTMRPGRMNITNMLLPAGEEVVFNAGSGTRWTGETVAAGWTAEIVDRRDRGLFRVWSLANMGTYGRANRAMGEQLAAATRVEPPAAPDLDPCLPMGMPAAMISPLPVEFVDRGDSIELRLTGFGNVRNIVLSGEVDGDAVPLSDLGYSTGQWVGQTLQVRTTRVGWPYVDDTGRTQTENVEITEEFALIDDGDRLRYTQTVTDPESFTAPVTVSWDWIDIGEASLNPVTCE